MSRAIQIVRSKMQGWKGAITQSGLIQFLSSGYLCKMLNDTPGGFTFFMFRSFHVEGSPDPKMLEQSTRETFGDAKLNDDTIRFYAKMNFYLPSSYEDFTIQLKTCYKMLELFTHKHAVASKGYIRAFQIMSDDYRRY
jgi:hypothetical protein